MVFIKNLKDKQRVWNEGTPVREASIATRRLIESTPQFKAIQAQKNAQVQSRVAALQKQKEDFLAKNRGKTKEEKSRENIDNLAKNIKIHGEMKINKVKTAEEARAMAVEIANKHDRDKGSK